ncbi:MAG: tRNA lysidine(34) synthetase TilS [Kiritimatiellales bacterium]|nr:tRNA lysidine(34) synthetase TilS [Kiritimatiellota bacterium]MBL7011378.1 tRNA lysidine(34) synthetase TilS [Kiritimatiellales bacterium]
MNLIEKVKAAIKREHLIPDGAEVIVGVSGGVDSVALLRILHRLGYKVTAAHLNHSIRGAQADADEQFVKDLCAQLGVECITAKADIPALAKEKGLSLEMAAREARHAFFRSLISDSCLLTSVICLAHHADDQLETFFLRAARGAGPAGLGGMRSSQKLAAMQLLRPMLGIRRSEIFQWLETEGLEWREDASNADETIPRNRVRHQILPVLNEINERAAENILRTMDILRDEEDHPEKSARRREARDWLIEHGSAPTFDAVEQFIEFSARTAGTTVLDLEGLRMINEYGTLRADSESFPRIGKIRIEESSGILRGKWQASISLAKVDGREVIIRPARPGDRMNPYGMDGSKKLQDIFTDLKIPQAQRAEWPVAECGGEIVWLPGYRIARGWDLSSDDEPALHLFCELKK